MPRLDDKDLKLLSALEENSRRTMVALAREIGLSRTATHERITRLEHERVIKRYTILVDEEAVDRSRAFFSIRLTNGCLSSELSEKIRQSFPIKAAHRLSGEASILLEVQSETDAEIVRISEGLAAIEGVRSLNIAYVLEGMEK